MSILDDDGDDDDADDDDDDDEDDGDHGDGDDDDEDDDADLQVSRSDAWGVARSDAPDVSRSDAYALVYIYIYIYIYTPAYIYIYLFIYIYVCIFIYTYIYMYVYIYTYIYIYTHIFIYIYIYTYIYTTCLFMKSPFNIYIYSVYAVKWTSALVLGSAQVVVYQIDWQSTGQQHRGLTLSTTRLSGWTLPDHPHLIVDHEFIRICPTAKYADISYSLQCGSRTDSAHESETWTNRKNKNGHVCCLKIGFLYCFVVCFRSKCHN